MHLFSNVFKRADDAMYHNKADMKRKHVAAEAEENAERPSKG